MRENTPPHSPYTEELTGIEGEEEDELIYLGDADEVLEAWENEANNEEDSEGEEALNADGEQDHEIDFPIPEQDDSILSFSRHNKPVFCGCFHPTENIVVTGGEDDKAYVWNLDDGEVIHECTGHNDTVIAAEFSSDGNYLATGDMAGEIFLLNVTQNYTKVWEYSMGDMSWMKWHPKLNILIAGAESGEMYAWRLPSGECKVFAGHGKRCETAAFTADGKKLVAGYNDGLIKLWDFKLNSVEFEIDNRNPFGHKGAVTAVSADRENSVFVSASEDGTIMIAGKSGSVGSLDARGGPVETVEICRDPDSTLKLAASGTLQGKITIWDITKQTVRAECTDDNPVGVTVSKWLPEHTLIVGTLDGTIKAFDGRSGQLKFKLLGHVAQIYDLKFHKEKNLVLTTCEDHTAKIFRLP